MLTGRIEEKWRKLTAVKKLLLSLAWFGLLCLFGLLLLKPLFLSFKQVRGQVKVMQLSRAQLKTERRSFKGMNQAVQPAQNPSDFLMVFIKACGKEGVRLLAMKVLPPIKKQDYQLVLVRLHLQGGYVPLLRCINRNPTAFIQEFTLEKAAPHSLLDMRISLILPGFWPVKAQSSFKLSDISDPFQAKLTLNQPETSLNRYPLSQLRLLGTLQVGEKHYAVIADPAGQIYHVVAGDFIGLEHTEILKIQKQSLLIREEGGGSVNLSREGLK